MDEQLKKVEAVLFAYGRRVTEEELTAVLQLPQAQITQLCKQLQQHYQTVPSSLELQQEGNLWKFTVKEDYADLVKDIVTKTELDRPTMETLAVIAFQYPVVQSVVINARGSSAYDHIKVLLDLGYITREKKGRSFQLRLTQKFFDYFDLPKDQLKEYFKEFEQTAEQIEQQEKEVETAKAQHEEQKDVQEKKDQHQVLGEQ